MPDLARVTVAIPVGPRPSHQKWLGECLDSVRNQTVEVDEILIINDMAELYPHELIEHAYGPNRGGTQVITDQDGSGRISGRRMDNGDRHLREWYAPFRLGVAAAFNMGVALAHNRLVVMLGSDDTLEPNAVDELLKTYEESGFAEAFYYFGVRYMDTGELQTLPCNCAAVTQDFWRYTGGFAPEMGVGACDSMFISQMLVHEQESLIPVAGGAPLFNYRRHDETDTAGRADYQGAIFSVRDILTRDWKPTAWGRYS